MEEPPSHVKFILCTTEPHKVPQTIQSRCQRFDFRNIPTKQIAAHLGAVAAGEKIEVTEDVQLAVARLANGSMRDGLSLLDRLLAASTGRVDAAVLEQVFGLPDDEILLDIVEACVTENTGDALRHGARLLERGSGVEQALELLAERFRWILVAAATAGTKDADDLLEVAQSMRERVMSIASSTDAAFAAHAIALCDATGRNARASSAPRALYDACLARLSLASRFAAGAAMLAGGGGVGTDSKKAGDPAARTAAGVSPATRAPERTAAGLPERVSTPAVEPKALPGGSVVAETATAAAAAPKPSADSAAPAPAKDLAELLARLAVVAEKSPRDHALLSQIEVISFTGDAAKVAVRSDGGGGYLVTNPDPVRTLLSRAAGRPVRVALEARETPGVPPPAKRTTVDARIVARSSDVTCATAATASSIPSTRKPVTPASMISSVGTPKAFSEASTIWRFTRIGVSAGKLPRSCRACAMRPRAVASTPAWSKTASKST
jgi:DNA polymerase III gamma/tau subunit